MVVLLSLVLVIELKVVVPIVIGSPENLAKINSWVPDGAMVVGTSKTSSKATVREA